MAEEIEIKLALDPSEHRRFLRLPVLREASGRTDQVLDNTYFDTPDLALRNRGIALRIRRQGRQRLQTVKLATNLGTVEGLSIRPEWETPYRGRFDFSPIEVAEVRDWLSQPAITDRIGPLFQTRFRRITWTFPIPDGGEILLALDRGSVVAGEREDTISEIELELSASQDVSALQALAIKLSTRLALAPELRSKAQRGYELMRQP